MFLYISLRLNTGVRDEGNRGNGLVKEIKLILSWQQAECVWVTGKHFTAHVHSLEGWSRWDEREFSDMNATQHTGLSSGLHDIPAIIGIKSKFVKKSTPHHLHKHQRTSSAQRSIS
jgi:hypothetical protein